MDKNEILEFINTNKVLKIIDDTSMVDGGNTAGLLAMEQLDRFIQAVQEGSPVLDEATFQKMNSYEKEISLIDTPTGYLYPGRVAGTKQGLNNITEFALTNALQANVLTAKEVFSVLRIDYDTLEDTIERGDFETTMTDIFARSARLDLERYFIWADTSYTIPSGNKLLAQTDGWAVLHENHIEGYGDDKEFDPSADDYPVNMFEAMLDTIDKKYLIPRNEVRFYVPWDVYRAYREMVMARVSAMGDEALRGGVPLTYDGIPVIPVPSLDDATAQALGGEIALLARPSNLVWGAYREIKIESDRDIINRVVNYVLTARVDATLQDRNAGVTAHISAP